MRPRRSVLKAHRTTADDATLARALDAIGDPWSSLILQEAFFGVRRFDEFQENLGIARNTLTDRLGRLAENGLLERRMYQESPVRHEYRLTPNGLAVYPYALTLMRWGDDWLAGKAGPPATLIHQPCGKPLQPVTTCSACKREIRAEDVSIGLGSARMTASPGTPMRLSSRPELYTSGRPTSSSRTQAAIGDRWGFFVLWLALAGITKFDHFHRILGVARTILTVRLERFVESGLLERRQYMERPARHDYHLTDKGRAMCPALLALFDWGRRWLGPDTGDTQVMHKSCAQPLRVNVVCGACRQVVWPHEVTVIINAPTVPANRKLRQL